MTQQPQPAGGLTELDLFPLNLTLFPGQVLPLHIFEERYKAMIGRCLRENRPFGVVLIREGREVGDPAEPFRVGTTARILRDEPLEEGRLNILTVGERRFEIVDITQRRPHVMALVQFLPEEAGEAAPEAETEARQLYGEYLQGLTALTGGFIRQVKTPDDPIRLAYGVAANLEFPRDIKQQLLEAPDAATRLSRLLPLLRRACETIKEEQARRNPYQGPRLN